MNLKLSNTILCVLVLVSKLGQHGASAEPQVSRRNQLSDEDIIKALAILLSESDTENVKIRQGRQRPVDFPFDDYDYDLEEESDRASLNRAFGRQDFEEVLGKCETTGYEVSTREECEEVNEIKCEPINITKYNVEIVERCKTLVDETCNVTYIDVPTQECKQKKVNKCETLYKTVEDTKYREECAVDVQHLCEHHVPVPVPVEVPYPVQHVQDDYAVPHERIKEEPLQRPIIGPQLPPDKLYSGPVAAAPPPPAASPPIIPYPPASSIPTSKPERSYLPPPSAHDQIISPSTSEAQLSLSSLPQEPLFLSDISETHRVPMMPYKYDPTPGPQHSASVSSIGSQSAFGDPSSHIPQYLQPFFRTPRQLSPLAYSLFQKLNHTRTRRSVGMSSEEVQLRDIVKQIMRDVLGSNQELNNVRATIRDSRSIDPVSFNLNVPHPEAHHHHPAPHLPKEPIITTHELPAPEGCRSIATKECHKIPIIVPRKVPYEVCNIVPDVECVNVLKKVPELQCTPEVYRDCNAEEKRVPYLEPSEECVEITFDECQEITERVPVELCKRKRKDEDSITLSKGKVERKEGEKRRTPAFRRGVNNKNKQKKKKSDQKDSKL